ncbi:efflux RND transporter periplasmic adaptor subunit [Clostridiaceae bacterium Marseille-Q4145]|nr:efflux RND transporter periplasmic adaptor subunit [Clostridiaceae bacterium Marseille-Q4145]
MILKKSKTKKEENTTELTVQKKTLTPEQKKKRKKRIIAGVAAVVIVGFAVSRMLTPAALPMVSVRSAQVGNIEQSVDASGTVTTEESKTYFSPVGAKISECKVQAGDAVAAGDVMLVYDAQDLEERQKEAELQNDEAKYTYENTIGKSNKDASEYSRSSHDVEILEQQVEDWKAEVHALKQYITDMGCFLREAQNEGHENDVEEYQNKIDQANNTLMVKEEELADFQSNLSEQKGIKNSTEDSMLTASGKKQIEATKDLAALKASQVTDAVAQVTDGLKAEFNGVVTDVKAVNGGTVEENGELLTVDSTENVCVKVSLNKSDLEKVKEGQKAAITIVGKPYEGTVTRISRSATKNEKGAALVTAEIHIDNPDQDLYLGVDGKVTIQGNKAENVVTVPIEAVNIGKDGSFVYIVDENGMIEKRIITTGLSSAEATEVKEGLDGTERVVLSVDAGIEEGMQVTPVEE